MSDEQTLPIQTFNMVELTDYKVDFQLIQHPTKQWIYCLQLYPDSNDPGYLSDNEEVPGYGLAKRIKDVKAVLTYSRGTYSQWEYAAEAAIDIIELLGFNVEEASHEFSVIKWDGEKHVRLTGIYSEQDFKLKDNKNG
jgi:hypothetical protein